MEDLRRWSKILSRESVLQIYNTQFIVVVKHIHPTFLLIKVPALKYIKLDANGIQSIIYDIISLLKATKECDEILVLGVSGCCFLPLYRLFSAEEIDCEY